MSNNKKTIVYIDSFNLYYGSLRGTEYKWLDLKQMAQRMIKPDHLITAVKVFTATPIPSDDDPDVARRQDVYFRALRAQIPEIEFINGHFLSHPIWARRSRPGRNGKPQYVEIMKSEEKGSDVNLSVHLLNDAWLDAFDSAIVVINDSDIAEAIKLARARKKIVGVLAPVKKPGEDNGRKVSHQLKTVASFLRIIGSRAITKSQMPSPIPGTNIHKPTGW